MKFRAQDMELAERYKIDPRRVQELMDARMIQEDERAMANCPTQPINKAFHHSYVNPYDSHSAIRPIPPRNRRYSDNEDGNMIRAMDEEESYGSEW